MGFQGSIDGNPSYSPRPGQPCAGKKGYVDLVAGGSVIVSDGQGVALGTTTLGAGSKVSEVKSTQSERAQREDLIDSIYELRKALKAGDSVAVAQLNLDRAQLRLKDLNTPGPPPPFEGHAFFAEWCKLDFTTAPLPEQPSYQIAVTHRGSTTFTAAQLPADLVIP